MPKISRWRKKTVTIPQAGATVEGYVRFSTANQRDGMTVEVQCKAIQQYCDARGWIVASWCIDEADSGGKDEIAERKMWAAHIARIGLDVQISVCLEAKRWSRNLETKLKSLRMISEQGGYWATADGAEDLHKLANDLGTKITSALSAINANAELDYMGIRIHQSKQQRAEVHGLHNGIVVFGYDYAPVPPPPAGFNKMVYKSSVRLPVVPDTTYIESAGMTRFEVLQQFGELRAAGKSYGEIAEWAYSRNIHTRKGLPFTDDAARIIFNSPLPRGKVHNPEATGTRLERLQQALLGQHVAAWDADLCTRIDTVNGEMHLFWQRTAGSITRSRREREGQYYNRVSYCYSGLLICAACKTTLIHLFPDRYMDKANRYGFPCPDEKHAGIREVYLDVCIARILDTVMPASWQAEIAEAVQQLAHMQETNSQQDEITIQQIADLDAERKRLSRQHQKQMITDDELDEAMEPILKAIRELKRTPKTVPIFDTQAILDQYQEWTNLATLWRESLATQRGELLTSIVQPHGIEVDLGQRQVIAIRPLPPFDTLCALRYPALDDGWYRVPIIPIEQFTDEAKEMALIREVKIHVRKDGQLRSTRRVMTPEIEDCIVGYLKEQRAINWIAKRCDVERSTIYKLAKRRHIVVDKRT